MACSKGRGTLGITCLHVETDDEKIQMFEYRGVESGVLVFRLVLVYINSLGCLPAWEVCCQCDVIGMRDSAMLAHIGEVV